MAEPAPQTYILVDAAPVDGGRRIVNAVMWDGNLDTWQPPAGLEAVLYAGPWKAGWLWDGTTAVDPNPPAPDDNAPPPIDQAGGGMTMV